jgi:hypothetical protein
LKDFILEEKGKNNVTGRSLHFPEKLSPSAELNTLEMINR